MPKEIKRLLEGKRPAGASLWFKRILAGLLILLLVTAGATWLNGQLVIRNLSMAMGLGQKAQIESDFILALPLINLVYGRNVVIQLKNTPPVKIILKSFYGQKKTDEPVWLIELNDLKFERGPGAVAATRLSFKARPNQDLRKISLADGQIDFFVLSAGRSAMTAFSRLTFKQFEIETMALKAAMAQVESHFNPLDLHWKLDETKIENFKIGLAFLDGYETAPLAVRFSSYNTTDQWALQLEMNSLMSTADDLGAGRRRSLTGFLNKTVGQGLDPARLLGFEKLNVSAGGVWSQAQGVKKSSWTESYYLFPRLFSLTIKGDGPELSKEEAAAWLGECFKKSEEEKIGMPLCLERLGFDNFTVAYRDSGLVHILRPVKSFKDKIFNDFDPAGPLGPPLLGVALGLWLEANDMSNFGIFSFKSDEGRPIEPFRRDFFKGLEQKKIAVDFSPTK